MAGPYAIRTRRNIKCRAARAPKKPPETPPEKPPDINSETTAEADPRSPGPDKSAKHIWFADDSIQGCRKARGLRS